MNALSTSTSGLSRSREIGLDSARTLAIAGMIAAHTSRMIVLEVRPAWCDWILLLEPVIPSLFLLLVGISLTLSQEKFRARLPEGAPDGSTGSWFLRQARRAAVLWLISMAFYLLEMGPRFPDFFTLSGILATISYAIVITAALLALPRSAWMLALALAGGAAIFLAVDGTSVFPLNSGDAPLLPLFLFTFAGALWSKARTRFPRPVFWCGLAAAGVAAWLIHRFGLHALFTKPFGRSDATRLVAAPLFLKGGERTIGYYNLGPWLALCCLALHLAGLSILGLLNRLGPAGVRRLRPLFTFGRHSLEVYVLHLALLAVLVVSFGPKPLPTPTLGNLTVAGVALCCMAWCWFREKSRLQR
jgi:uncharacterized membrane protein